MPIASQSLPSTRGHCVLGCSDVPSWTRSNTTQQSHRHNSHHAGSLCSTSSQDPIPTQPRSSCSTSHGNSPSTRLVDARASSYPRPVLLAHWLALPPIEQLSSQAPLACQQASARHSLGLPDLENGPRGKWRWGLLELVRMVSYQLLPPF